MLGPALSVLVITRLPFSVPDDPIFATRSESYENPFAGYAVPVESMPRVFQVISNFFPIRHWMIIMRGIMLKDVGLDVFWPHVLAIGGLGVVLTLATLVVFRKALQD